MQIDHHFIAGTAGGVITSLLLHPLDVVKVRLQVQDGKVIESKYRGVWHAVTSIYKAEGAVGFYRGVLPACYGAGLSWGVYFYFYEAAKRRLLRGMEASGASSSSDAPADTPRPQLSLWQNMYCAWEAGTIGCFITNPFWLVKTRLQLQTNAYGTRDAKSYRSMTGEAAHVSLFSLV
jgi:solute carrier family 25 folate transporter 32